MPGLPFLRAGNNILYGAGVSTTVGATDASHIDDWLTDGRNRPARATSGTVTWTAVALVSGPVTVAIVHNHTIDAARTVTIGGDVSGTGVGLSDRDNDISVSLWIPCTSQVSPIDDVTDVSLGIASNSRAVVVAELLAGEFDELTNDFSIANATIGYLDIGTVRRQSVGGSVPNFGRGLVARFIQGDILVDDAERDLIMAWYESTREEVRPSAIKPFDASNEAWMVSFGAQPTFKRLDNLWIASLLFHEWPRKRWL